MAKEFYEKGFSPKSPIKGFSEGGDVKSAEPGYLEGHNSSPSFKKYNYEADGGGSKGPAAK